MDFVSSLAGSSLGDYATETLTKFTPVQRHVAQYLVRVYTMLGATVIAAAAGAIFHLYTNTGGLMSMIGGFVAMFWLMSTNPQHTSKRVKLLLLSVHCWAYRPVLSSSLRWRSTSCTVFL